MRSAERIGHVPWYRAHLRVPRDRLCRPVNRRRHSFLRLLFDHVTVDAGFTSDDAIRLFGALPADRRLRP